jgi:hypothetical protein
MPEPQAAPAPVAAAEAPAAPAAAPETFAQQMERHGGFGDDTGEPDAPDEAPAPAAPKTVKKVVDPKGAEIAQLREMAKRHGFEVEDGKLLPSEVAKFRGWKRDQRAAFESELTKRTEQFANKEKTHAERVSKAEALEKASEAGDYEQIAKLLGHEDWNKLQEAVIARVSDPNYKRLRELEQWKEEQAKREDETKKQAEARQQQEKKAQATREWVKTQIVDRAAKSKDPLVAAMHDEPFFAAAIHRIQRDHYDGGSDPEKAVPSVDKAINLAAKGAPHTLRQELERLYSKLSKALAKPEAAPPVANRKPAPKSAPVPPSAATEASSPGSWGDRPKSEWLKYQRARLQEAAEKDRRDGT